VIALVELNAAIAAEVERCSKLCGLSIQPQALTEAELTRGVRALGDGREVMRELIWHEFSAERSVAALALGAGMFVRAIHHKHGSGKVWCFGPLVHVIDDDGMIVHDGRLRLRSLYAHEATARAEVPR